jgi:hypothetical protein
MLALCDIVSCCLPFSIMPVTGFVFSMFSGSRGKKLVFDPLLSITSQVWGDVPVADILSPYVLRFVGLLTSHDRAGWSCRRQYRSAGLETPSPDHRLKL